LEKFKLVIPGINIEIILSPFTGFFILKREKNKDLKRRKIPLFP
jgi:hypothetical protein